MTAGEQTWTYDTKRNVRSVARRRGAIALALAAIAGTVLACGGSELDPDALPVLTIDECREVGGAPLFDPADERPVASSCPEGLGFLGVFDEPFFGSDGGICCGAPEPADEEGAPQPDGAAQSAGAQQSDGAEQPDAVEPGSDPAP